MAYIYEVNGQRVEFEKEPTDADIDEAARSLGPAPNQQEKQGSVAPEISGIEAVSPQLASAGARVAGEVPGAVRAGVELGKQGIQAIGSMPAQQAARVAIDTASVMAGHPPYASILRTATDTATGTPLKQVIGNAVNTVKNAGSAVGSGLASGARNVGGALVRGAVAPESAFLMPYQMAAYEQEKIRANPNAPEYATNPYAQSYRSQDTATPITQRQAGAMNVRNAVANVATGYTPNPQEAQNILASGDERMINMYGGRLKLQGLASPGPNAFNSGFAQQLNRMGR